MLAWFLTAGGMYILMDGVASLWQYTRPERKDDQSWLRDHSFRLMRMVWGILFLWLGALA